MGGAGAVSRLERLARDVSACRACPRLVEWREQVAREKRAAYRNEAYWGRPVPGFGDPEASVLVIGLAPGAHGANRTGRMFTGDRSGDWLYRALHRAGFANQAASTDAQDGLELRGAFVTAGVRCVPPGNRPTAEERDACAPFLRAEVRHFIPRLAVVVCLGSFAWAVGLAALAREGLEVPSPKPRFAHGAEAELGPLTALASYHPSQQNTFTKRLTESMFDAVWARAAELAGRS